MSHPFHPRLVFNYPLGIIGSLSTHDKGGLPHPPGYLRTASSMIPQDGGLLPGPPQTRNRKEGWIGDGLIHGAWRMLEAVVRKLGGL